MKSAAAVLLLFCIQLYLVFSGADCFGMYWNPFYILIVSIPIAVIYLSQAQRFSFVSVPVLPIVRLVALGFTALMIIWCGILIHTLFYSIPRPVEYSDVLPQIDTVYDRFARGEQPYYPVPMKGWAPFPVYMPLHWLPLGIPKAFGRDLRWAGFLPLAASMLFYTWKRVNSWASLITALLPGIVLYCFIKYSGVDMAVTLETLIAAYYLLLATGLAGNSHMVVITGIICCLLSRYTLAFWLPLFAILLWHNRKSRQSFITWGIVGLSVLILYILPFYARKPSTLKEGVAYHNQCAIDDWRGNGHPPVSWTHTTGVSFGGDMKALFPGDAAQQVTLSRILQACLMLLLVIIGVWYYRRIKDRVSFYRYSLAMLYYCILLFYLFGPLTYRYYWISLLMISAVLCGEVVEMAGLRSTKPTR